MSYTPLPLDQDQELRDAFESDDEESQIVSDVPPSTSVPRIHQTSLSIATPGAYNFEREYDYPPPGSPPGPLAVHNTWGNTNGILPVQPLRTITQTSNWFRRILGPILPTSYQRLPTAEGSGRVIGGGMENGGVFSNLAAKPTAPRTTIDANGNIHIVPEDTQREAPPTYADAEADAAPSYWGATVHAPSGLDGLNMTMIDNLPAGPILAFVANLIVSYFFQFVGFLLTYLLHTNHAAKYGSRAGFGLTLIAWGYNARSIAAAEQSDTTRSEGNMYLEDGFPYFRNHTINGTDSLIPVPARQMHVNQTAQVWVSFLLMTIGWFLFLSSCAGFYRVKLWETRLISAQNASSSDSSTESGQSAIRLAIQQVFGRGDRATPGSVELQEISSRVGTAPVQRTRQERIDAQLERDLRDAGFL